MARRKNNGRQGGGSIKELRDPKTLRQEAWNQTRGEYGPTIRSAEGMRRGSIERQKNIGQWFQGLQNQIQESAAQTDASYGQANAALLAHMQSAQEAAAKSQESIGKYNADMSKLVGADPSLTVPALTEGAAAAGQRDIAMAALAAPISQAGASQAAYLRNTGINARREGIDQKLKEGERRREIIADVAALRKEQAERANSRYGELLGKERDYQVQRGAFNLDRKEGALNRAQDERQFNAGQSLRERELDEGALGGEGGMTAAEQRDRKQSWNNARAAAQTLFESRQWPSWAALAKAVMKQSEVNPAMAKAAVKKLRERVEQKQKNAAVGDAAGGVTKGVNPF